MVKRITCTHADLYFFLQTNTTQMIIKRWPHKVLVLRNWMLRHCFVSILLLLITCIWCRVLLVRYPSSRNFPTRENPYKHTQKSNVLLFSHISSQASCANSIMRGWTFIREYFEDSQRGFELSGAIRQTILRNKCAKFVFLIQHAHYLDKLKDLSIETDATTEVYWVASPLTMSVLFNGALWANTAQTFVVSTGDVAIGSLDLVQSACGRALAESALMVVSRRDNSSNDQALTDCLSYRNLGSFDIYIGNISLVQEEKLRSIVISPSYWGVENLTAFVLARNRVFNLCPHIDVLHSHSSRNNQSWRPRINHFDNSVESFSDISDVCDINILKYGG